MNLYFNKKISSLLIFSLLLSGCMTYKSNFSPDAAYFERLETQENGPIKVSVVGLSAKEGKETFGVNLTSRHILPIWIKIENKDPKHSYFFVERSIDPDYYTAGEAAYIAQFHAGQRLSPFFPPFLMSLVRLFVFPFDSIIAGNANTKMAKEFKKNALKYGWIKPSEVRSGFMFVPFELGTKEVAIDLYSDRIKESEGVRKSFNFFINIPGLKTDYIHRDFNALYPKDQTTDIQTEEELIKTLESLPCCMSNKKGQLGGDPMNLFVVGTLDDVLNSFSAANWDETEVIYFGSVWQMIKSFSFKKKYMYSPISPQYYDNRSQDISFQKARQTISERMHLRLWHSSLKFQGRPVWIGAVSRDIGVKFTTTSWNLMTHAIDPDIDESSLYTLSDLIYNHRLEKYAVIKGLVPSTEEKPAYNIQKSPYYTSGDRVVLVLSKSKQLDFPPRMGVQSSIEQ